MRRNLRRQDDLQTQSSDLVFLGCCKGITFVIHTAPVADSNTSCPEATGSSLCNSEREDSPMLQLARSHAIHGTSKSKLYTLQHCHLSP